MGNQETLTKQMTRMSFKNEKEALFTMKSKAFMKLNKKEIIKTSWRRLSSQLEGALRTNANDEWGPEFLLKYRVLQLQQEGSLWPKL